MNISIEKFEGPLALLLTLIEKEEMDITQVSLAKIADQFVEYLKNQKNNLDPEEMADFLVVAAKLLLIKSKALLPFLYPEEEAEIEEFEEQLRMYKEFVDAAKKIEKMLGKKKFMFVREFNRKAILANINLFAPPKELTSASMKMIMSDILGRLQPPEKLEEKTLEHKVTIEEKIMHIQKSLLERIKISFNNLLNSANSKTDIIVSFLAMLELIKQRELTAYQEGLFEEIMITKNSIEVQKSVIIEEGIV